MPWKTEVIQYIPFLGMMAGKAPVPSRSMMELAIVALLPILFGAIYLIPKLDQKITGIEDARAHDVISYSQSINGMASNIKELSLNVNSLKTDIEVIKVSNEFIKEVANTKVKTIEGRMGVLEHELRRLNK